MATNAPVATSNLIQQKIGISVSVPDPDDPVEKEYQKLLEEDDQAQEEVDAWIRANAMFDANGAGMSDEALNVRIRARLETVRTNYVAFLEEHPDHARAHLAFASFLMDIGSEVPAVEHMEKSRELDPTNPAAWNNLANHYGHRGPVKKAFEYYEKAIELNPYEPVYYHNYGTTVFLFRKDAREYFGITEQEVFNKALQLYGQSLRLAPKDFPLASDIAQTYYGIQPFRGEDALRAWNYTMSIARDQIERDGVHIHLARVNREMGNFAEARAHLNIVTNSIYDELKARVYRSINDEEKAATNAAPEAVSSESPESGGG